MKSSTDFRFRHSMQKVRATRFTSWIMSKFIKTIRRMVRRSKKRVKNPSIQFCCCEWSRVWWWDEPILARISSTSRTRLNYTLCVYIIWCAHRVNKKLNSFFLILFLSLSRIFIIHSFNHSRIHNIIIRILTTQRTHFLKIPYQLRRQTRTTTRNYELLFNIRNR